jgi:putative lipoic acid-binding regulatory protein
MALTKNSQIDLNGNEMILDADADTSITADTDDQIDIKVGGTDTVVITGGAMALKGATPTLTIGDAGAEDTKIVFDGNAQDFYIGLDDSADDLVIGKGSAVGTTPAISVDENQKVTFTKDIEVQGDSTSGSEGGHITLRAASGGSKEFGIDVDSSNRLRIITEDDGTGDNGAAHVYVTNTGNVGIGTSDTDSHRMAIDSGSGTSLGLMHKSSNSFTLMTFKASGTTQDIRLGATGDDMTFQTNGGERMRITTQGNLLKNTTYDGFNAAQVIYATGTNPQATNLTLWSLGGSGIKFVQFVNSSGVQCGSITQNGTSAVTYGSGSDYRLKENVKPLENGLSKVQKLNPVQFDWKESGETNEGFIAHEVQEICKEAVSGQKDGEEMQGVDYGRITPLLVKAIQEQQEQIEALQSEINTLKGG